jgi:hypothetical protein
MLSGRDGDAEIDLTHTAVKESVDGVIEERKNVIGAIKTMASIAGVESGIAGIDLNDATIGETAPD